jgi:hypothetical protein
VGVIEIRSELILAANIASQPQHGPESVPVVIRAGKRLVTDGPFAETKEQLGG